MVWIVEKIDKALEGKTRCTIIDKMGRHLHGIVTDSWIRISAGRLRGKLRFASDEKGEVEIDANDILDLLITSQ